MAKFNYAGKPGTCYWCGKKVKEKWVRVFLPHVGNDPLQRLAALEAVPKVGESFTYQGQSCAIREVVGVVDTDVGLHSGRSTTRTRKAKPGEYAKEYHVFLTPPVWDGYPSYAPMFDTQTCATSFAIRAVELDFRLGKRNHEG